MVARRRKSATQRSQLYSEQSYYTNYIHNMYPSAVRGDSQPPTNAANDDDPVNQQMRLLMLRDARPSPDATSSTFRIDLPEDVEERERLCSGGFGHASIIMPYIFVCKHVWDASRSSSETDESAEKVSKCRKCMSSLLPLKRERAIRGNRECR